jgi:hypothetical protein
MSLLLVPQTGIQRFPSMPESLDWHAQKSDDQLVVEVENTLIPDHRALLFSGATRGTQNQPFLLPGRSDG